MVMLWNGVAYILYYRKIVVIFFHCVCVCHREILEPLPGRETQVVQMWIRIPLLGQHTDVASVL